MHYDLAHDPHPDDAEAERLLVQYGKSLSFLASLLDLPPSDSRDRDERWVRDDMARIQQALKNLTYGSPDDAPITHSPIEPRLPLLPGPQMSAAEYDEFLREMVDRASTEVRPRSEADATIARAVEKALSDLTANPRAEPPRLTAMRVLDHYVARGEPLPHLALELLARAMRIDPRHVVAAQRRVRIAGAAEAGPGTKEIATELGIDPRTVRLLRNSPTPDAAALFAAVAEGKDLRALRPAVATALGLLGDDGRWRTDVLATIHGGAREPDLIRAAARVEAQRRSDGEEPNVAGRIARAARIDIRRVRRWIARPDWEMAVTVETVWLRGWRGTGLPRMAARVEALRRLDGHPVNHAVQIAAALETPCPADPSKVRQIIDSPGWEHAVAAEHAEAVWLRGQQGAGRNPGADQ